MAKHKRKVYCESFDDGGAASGIPCPDCACRHSYVTRTEKIGGVIRRTRQCRHCGRTFYTTETA